MNRGGSAGAVLCIDLDHFKDVNDTLGHHIGDELIGAVTKRLRHIVRDEALVARLGGDEFAVITPGATDSATLSTIANRIIAVALRPLLDRGPHHRDRRQRRHRDRGPPIGPSRPTSCGTPTWRSTAPRTKDGAGPASTTMP